MENSKLTNINSHAKFQSLLGKPSVNKVKLYNFHDMDLVDIILEGINVSKSYFKNLSFKSTEMSESKFHDRTFINCDFSRSNLEHTIFDECSFFDNEKDSK